jgi:hypothetical protein
MDARSVRVVLVFFMFFMESLPSHVLEVSPVMVIAVGITSEEVPPIRR